MYAPPNCSSRLADGITRRATSFAKIIRPRKSTSASSSAVMAIPHFGVPTSLAVPSSDDTSSRLASRPRVSRSAIAFVVSSSFAATKGGLTDCRIIRHPATSPNATVVRIDGFLQVSAQRTLGGHVKPMDTFNGMTIHPNCTVGAMRHGDRAGSELAGCADPAYALKRLPDCQQTPRVRHGHRLDLGLADTGLPQPRQERSREVRVAVALVAGQLRVVADVLGEQHALDMAA